jgi:hypothetical protein
MPPDPDYEVGYKKPPQHTRFQKGPKLAAGKPSLLQFVFGQSLAYTKSH